MKNLSTQEIFELLRTLDHRGVSREEVLKALCSDVEKHKEIGEFLVLRAQEGLPEDNGLGESNFVLVFTKGGARYQDWYDHNYECWEQTRIPDVLHWYDFGSE